MQYPKKKVGGTLELSKRIMGNIELNQKTLCPSKFVIRAYYGILGTDKGNMLKLKDLLRRIYNYAWMLKWAICNTSGMAMDIKVNVTFESD